MKHIVIIERNKCKAPQKCDYICMRFCPIQKAGKSIFQISEKDNKPLIDETECIGCGLCVKKCPFSALKIINILKEPEKDLIFQYGPNSFRLYRLPIIKENSVIGIIGRNGMGKSTALSILAGLLKPNFGNYDKEYSEKEIIRYFRGSELQKYFEKLYNKEIQISFKIQEIHLFAKLYGNKTVLELLNQLNIQNLDEIIDKFNIKHLLNRKIKELSGGELQKVFIILSSYKPANVYFYDEPTAFLDIAERVKIALFLNNKKEEKKTILIIDHDLLFLDFLSDIIHIVYGIPKAYGVFSYPIGAKEGINQFLEGFIRRENLRIRDYKIKLDIKPYEDIYSTEALISWSNLKLQLDNFRLETEEGEIYKKEILGVVGPNGIGKSTFAKILAGVIKNYEGKLSSAVEISYKPQFLELSDTYKDISVLQFLTKMNPNFKTEYKEWLADLSIPELYEHTLNILSGGELQTVFTFGCLIKDADLYILDEPFAYLDIEQRIRLSKFIRECIKNKEKACLIIEHDLLFLDYVSDRIMPFIGEGGKYGKALTPKINKEALNIFLKTIDITIRRDEETNRPRINKPGSYLDKIQKEQGLYYI